MAIADLESDRQMSDAIKNDQQGSLAIDHVWRRNFEVEIRRAGISPY